MISKLFIYHDYDLWEIMIKEWLRADRRDSKSQLCIC
jgi:hypothetical protein